MTSVRVAILVLTLALGAEPAASHSLLLASDPRPNAVLTASPSQIMLRFNNRIEKRLSRVRLVDERGAVATAPTAHANDETADMLLAAVPPLAPGAWRVEWQVFSTDGHVVSGSYQFRLAP